MPFRVHTTITLFTLIVAAFFLSSCASSDVSRQTSRQVDTTLQGAKDALFSPTDYNVADAYQNTSQTTKGAIIGGVGGAVAGGLTSGVGIVPGTATGAILGAAYGAYIDSKTTIEDQIKNRGINVIMLGDQIRIIIPSSSLFQSMTGKIRQQGYASLYLVTQFLNQFTLMTVRVASYTSNTGSPRVNLALTKEQSESVAKFLVDSNLNARVVYAQGYDGTNFIVSNNLDWDSDNYRIEITTEKLPV